MLINFLFEIITEASLRMPDALGMALSIVGALALGNTAVEMRKLYRRTVHDAFAISAMILTMIAFLGGIMIHQILMNKTCEDVFEKFYSEKYEKEIAEPFKMAQKEAADYLKQQQKQCLSKRC